MTDSNLATDYQAMMARLEPQLNPLTSSADLTAILRNELLPFFGNLIEEIGEIDGAVEDMIHNADDILQPETAEVFAALVVGCKALLVELRKRVDKDKEPRVWAGILQMDQVVKAAETTLEEITVPEDEDELEEPEPGAPAASVTDDADDDEDEDEDDDEDDAK